MDFTFNEHGSVILMVPTSKTAWAFIHQHVYYEDWQLYGDGIVMEPRMAQDIAEALVNEGFTIGVGGLT